MALAQFSAGGNDPEWRMIKRLAIILPVLAVVCTGLYYGAYSVWWVSITFDRFQTHLVNIDHSVQDVGKKGDVRDDDLKTVQKTLDTHSDQIKTVADGLSHLSDQISNFELKATGTPSAPRAKDPNHH
jgi:hypothetical protein